MRMLPCLACEGTGVVRKYINVAGSYDVYHCKACEGTGYMEYEEPIYEE